MQATKIIAISLFGILLSACDPNQMQVEGSSGADAVGKKHSHMLPDDSKHIHQHTSDSSPAHTHSMEQIKQEMGK